MSTPKKIRNVYKTTFERLISTSPASKRFRQFLSSMRVPSQAFNLPITLEDVRTSFLSPFDAVKKPTRRKTTTRARPAVKKVAVKKAAAKKTAARKPTARKTTVRKAPAKRTSRKK